MIPILLALASPLPSAPQGELSDPRRTQVVEIIERVKPAVVSIFTNVQQQGIDWLGRFIQRDVAGPSGTGVLIYEDGFIITNHHVVAGATQIEVRFDPADDERTYAAQLVSSIPEQDLALLKIAGEEPFATVTMCETDPILGEPVIAIGNAFGHTHTVSTGIVSGLHRNIDTHQGLHFDNLIQTDASINPGNSGGPLLNANGELLGINSAMQGTAENIGFAIPVSRVRKVLSEELLALSVAIAWVGFEVDEASLTVSSVFPGGPAETAGLRVGDRLLALNNHLLAGGETDARDVYRRLRIAIQPKTVVALEVLRGREREKLELVAWNKVDGILHEHLGLGLETVRIGPYGGNPFLLVPARQRGPARRARGHRRDRGRRRAHDGAAPAPARALLPPARPARRGRGEPEAGDVARGRAVARPRPGRHLLRARRAARLLGRAARTAHRALGARATRSGAQASSIHGLAARTSPEGARARSSR
jgi:serine protease Do